jgi:predicted small secreted protein
MKIARLAPMALIAVALLASGCANTIRGAGRDISNTVDATGDAAKDVAN